ncbi:hypothetical protein HZB02_06955 [Candidatus Woesearchaeota archaeon]|nr:hypothetical protein [Candidatus Woesearchaeota archaeon]
MEKGVVSSIQIKNKKNYQAADPRRLEEVATQRLENLQKIIPQLIQYQNFVTEEIKVELHKGKHVYKTLLNDIIVTLKRNDEVLVYGIDDDILLRLDKYTPSNLNLYLAKAVKLNIHEKVIAKQGNTVLKEAKTTTYRFLPKDVIGNAAFEVYGNKVAILLWGSPNHLILITDKEVADSYRNQFKILWENANPK